MMAREHVRVGLGAMGPCRQRRVAPTAFTKVVRCAPRPRDFLPTLYKIGTAGGNLPLPFALATLAFVFPRMLLSTRALA
jgi:hypothetical protein